MAADASPPETALSAANGPGDEDGEEGEAEQCRICRLPAEADRPLRHPCACRGSIRFVHDDCQLRWLATRRGPRCELCNNDISIRPVYAADAPARLPVSEFMAGFSHKLMDLLLLLICLVPALVMYLITLGAWLFALARSFAQVHHLLSLRPSVASIVAQTAIFILRLPGIILRGVVGSIPSVALIVAQSAIFILRLPGIFLRGVVRSIPAANFCLNLLSAKILHPVFFGWALDICTSEMFGATMSQRFKLMLASSFASTVLHWYFGCIFWHLGLRFFRLLDKILRPGIAIPFVHYEAHEPFYKFYLKKLHILFVGIISMVLVILVPIQIGGLLVPELFPFHITYFNCGAKGISFWQAPRNYVDSVSHALLLKFLIDNTKTLVYLEWLVKKVTQYSFVTTGHALGLSDSLSIWPDDASGHDEIGSSVAPEDQYDRINEAKDGRRSVAAATILSLVLAWLTIVVFNLAVLIFPISIGHAITRLPLAGGLKSDDMLALAIGFGAISTVIAASRDSFAYMTSGRTHLLALNRYLVVFLWLVIAPFLTGVLVDLSLISPFTGLDDDVPAVGLSYYWGLGCLSLKIWGKQARRTRARCLRAYFIDERWGPKLNQAKADWDSGIAPMWWFLRDVCMPIVAKLLAALGVPYVLAKGVFPRFGCSVAMNSAVYRFVWLGSLGFYLAKALCAKLHDSIRDARYVVGQRLEDVADGS
ncbi:probable E3 ubiquitin ligase SUD1 [Aegilops tauschii subsp. strangulata]|nr:probable E3 ubiquitin ligase SUD1 [Aegilops tauschii subsp. strangulata]